MRERRRLESEIQRDIVSRYERNGYIAVKIGLCNKPGFPDLMMLKEGEVLFIEVKRPGEKPRPLQEYRIAELRKAGFTVIVLNI